MLYMQNAAEDGYNLNKAYRRTTFRPCDDIGEWALTLKFITILSVVTNATVRSSPRPLTCLVSRLRWFTGTELFGHKP